MKRLNPPAVSAGVILVLTLFACGEPVPTGPAKDTQPAFAQTPATVEYQLIDLGLLYSSYPSAVYPAALNESDQVVGRTSHRAFLWEYGSMISLGTLGGGSSSAVGINNSGQIVGVSRYTTRNYDEHAFLYEGNTMVDLGTIANPSTSESAAYGINDAGFITGFSEYYDGNPFGTLKPHAFVYDGSLMTSIGTLTPPMGSSTGTDINESGHITGWSYATNTAVNHAFLYNGNAMVDLGTLGGPESASYGRAINNNDQVTGYSFTEDGGKRAFITNGTSMVSIGTLGGANYSEGYDINDSGHVTGFSANAEGKTEAFLYDGTEMLSLCSLADCQGWSSLRVGTAINNRGSIAGYGYLAGDLLRARGFLLQVLPPPPPPFTPPVADAGPDQTVECTGDGCAEVTLDGSGSSDPDGDALTYSWGVNGAEFSTDVSPTIKVPLGTTGFTLTVSDGVLDDTDDVAITVEDTAPPVINAAAASPDELWPPNHSLITVDVTVDVVDLCDLEASCAIASVTSSEPDNGPGDGDTPNDIQITGPLTVDLRAERSGQGDGRVYTISVACTDASGNTSYGDVEVRVPKSKSKKK